MSDPLDWMGPYLDALKMQRLSAWACPAGLRDREDRRAHAALERRVLGMVGRIFGADREEGR